MDFVHLFQNIPHWLATMMTAMLPIGELRAALPIALTVYNMPFWEAYLFSVAGNLIPVAFILWFLDPVSKWLMKHSKLMNRFFTWLFDRTQKKHTKKFEKWGVIALITFVAIPLPITGAWTGSVAAFVFGIPFKKAFPLIAIGVLIAGIIVGAMTLGVASVF
ncbi:small multi-drug export protein [Patescibacteria group bacterium]|nr:small multi-drug export protein [Patescibacteria group bacterium]